MSLTRDPIITEVMAETGRTDKQAYLETVFPDVLYEMSRAVTKEGFPIILQDLKTIESLSIVDTNYFVALPTNFVFQYGTPELLHTTNQGRQLIKKSLEWLDYNYPNRANNSDSKDKPIYYSLENNRFDFAPKSDASYTITFPHTLLHPEVDENGDTILFRDHFKDVIKDYLKGKLFEKLDDPDKMVFHNTRGLSILESLGFIDRGNAGA